MKKARDNKLVKQFESAINEYLASPDLLVNKDFSPNFDKIEKFIKKNKSIIKENKKGYPARQLKEFYRYLKSLNGDDQSVRILGFYKGNKTIVLSGKAAEAYKTLLKQIESYFPHEASRENTTFPIETDVSLSTGIKNVASYVVKNAGALTGSLKELLTAEASNPWLSIKAATGFALYTLAGQPVAGMTLANTIRSEQTDPMPTLNHLLGSDKSDWFRHYDYLESMLQEFDSNSLAIHEKDKRLFFEFLEKVFIGGKASELSDESKTRLFHIVKNELEDTSYYLNELSDVKKIYRLFYIVSKLDYKKYQRSVETIFELLDRYETKLASHRIIFNLENEQRIEHEIGNIFWVLQINFDEYAESLVRFSGIDKFKRHFDILQKINQEIYRWGSDSIFFFRFSLDTIRRLRFYYFNDNQEISSYLNDAAQVNIDEALRWVENKCLSLTEVEIKEAAYIAYVRKLPSEARQSFTGLYKKVEKKEVFPDFYQYQASSQGSANTAQFVIHHQQLLSEDQKAIVNNTINNTYQRLEKFKSDLGVTNKEDVSKIMFRVHLFKDHDNYSNYGPLWGINTAGGGYAHLRVPSDDELQFDVSRSFEKDKLWYEIFIYYREGDTRNAKNKEGGGFRNLGHEIQHTLFYALIGAHKLNNLPPWLIEGIANYLGNENCFKEEADYIKRYQKKYGLPSIEKIINFNYANGGDLYYFDSTLVRFMREKYRHKLKEILIAAQTGKTASEINQIIEQWAADPTVKKEFKAWTTQLINECSAISEDLDKEVALDVQAEYLKDLQNHPNLSAFIKQKGSIEFKSKHNIFKLEPTKLTIYSYFEDRSDLKPEEIVNDYLGHYYNLFKRGLAFYVAKIWLDKNGIIENQEKILENYFDESIHLIGSYTVKAVSALDDPIQQIIEEFALESCFPLIFRKSLSKEDLYSRLLETPAEKGVLFPTCQTYLNEKNKSILDKVQIEYRNDLEKNPNWLHFIQKKGFIEFVFGDTVFNLTANGINRHYNGSPQLMTRGDYNWLKSALAIYTTQITLQPFNLPAENHHEIVKHFLRKADDELSNKAIKGIQPQADSDFNRVITDFVLNTYFQKSKQEFHTHLSKAVASYKKSVLSSSTPRPDKSESLPITTPSTQLLTEVYYPASRSFSQRSMLIDKIGKPNLSKRSTLSSSTTLSNRSKPLPINVPFTHLPIEVNYLTSSTLSPHSTLIEASNGTEFPTLRAPTSESWQPSTPLIAGLGAAAGVIGIGAATFCYCYKKRKAVTSCDSEQPQATRGLPGSVASTQSERMPLTTLSINDNERISKGCTTTQHLVSKNGKPIKSDLSFEQSVPLLPNQTSNSSAAFFSSRHKKPVDTSISLPRPGNVACV